MKTKKMGKVLVLSILGVFALTGCDDIVAKPTQYDDPLITTANYSGELYNNIASSVYDSIHDTGIGGDVLNQVLYLYAVNTYGPYNGNVVVNAKKVSELENTTTLIEACNDASKLDDFVLAHRGYWDYDRKDTSTAVTVGERQRVKAKLKSINARIAEEMYNKIAGGTYSDRHYFSEAKFLKALYNSLESVSDPSSVTAYADQPILPAVEPEKVFENYLHMDFYHSDTNTYVVDEIIPNIYRDLLSEQYLFDETYNTLGRSYARKVNIIKFNNNENYPNMAYKLAKQLVGEINNTSIEGYNASLIGTRGVLQRFKDYSNAQVGLIEGHPEIVGIFSTAHIDAFDPDDYPISVQTELKADLGAYYPGTNYGDLAEKYTKMRNIAENGVNTELENTYTNSGAYPWYVGLQLEKRTLAENDNTNNGWFIKNGGLTDLPDSIRSRLFNIGVATGVKESTNDRNAYQRKYTDGAWVEGEKENSYVCRINGHNYLKTATRVKGDTMDLDILHYDSESKAYYIIEVEEAVSSSKLSRKGDHNYKNLRNDEDMETIINDVAKVVGFSESYTTLATKKYLKEMSIEYHDQSVYDYFKSNYPELFDDDTKEDSSDSDSSDSSDTSEK